MKFSTRRALAVLAITCAGGVFAADACNAGKEKFDDTIQQKLVADGIAMLNGGDPAGAIRDYFDKAIALNDIRIAASDKRVYAARTLPESLLYMMSATQDPGHAGAVVYGSQLTYAHFMKAYALVELHRAADAKLELDAALALSPSNAQVLDETGTWYLGQKDWEHALQYYRRAEEAIALAPPERSNHELGAAWRGMGYVYVERHLLAEAEQMYQKCLQMDANDKKAANELSYVRALLAKQGAH